MKKINTLAALALLTGFAGVAHAAVLPPVTLNITGTIKVGTCTPSIIGSADYQTIDRAGLSLTEYNPQAVKPVALNVSCTAPSRFMVKVVDNRAADVPSLTDLPFTSYDGNGVTTAVLRTGYLGLARTSAQANVGAYALSFGAPIVDGQGKKISAGATAEDGNGETDLAISYDSSTFAYFGASENEKLVYGKEFNFPIFVAATIVKANDLPAGQDINLDGSATLEVHYI